MKDNVIVIAVIAGVALLFWAVSTGLIKTTGGNVAIGGGIVAPQPAQNYSGYLAASTAPAVSNALSGAVSGLSSSLSSWLSGLGGSTATPVGQAANPNSPALAAQPIGPQVIPTLGSYAGPQVDPLLAYDSTSGSAYDYAGLAGANSYDPSYDLSTGAYSA
jgi:hypothetical protein